MNNNDVLQSGRQGRRQVWLLTANGLAAGLATLLVVWVAQRHIETERGAHDATLHSLSEIVGSLEKLRSTERYQIQQLLSERHTAKNGSLASTGSDVNDPTVARLGDDRQPHRRRSPIGNSASRKSR